MSAHPDLPVAERTLLDVAVRVVNPTGKDAAVAAAASFVWQRPVLLFAEANHLVSRPLQRQVLV